MRPLILTLLFFLIVSDGSGAQLKRISTSESASSTQIYLHFDEQPLHREKITNRRLDLTLLDTQVSKPLDQPEPSDVLIKTLVVEQQEDTRLSLFFRYVPQDFSITGTSDGMLVIDLIPGNRFTGAFRELESRFGPLLPVEQRKETLINPLVFTPYRDNWRSFFTEYVDTPILAPLPAPFFPPFPLTSLLITADTNDFVSAELDGQDMFESLRYVQKQLRSNIDEDQRKYYALTHADLLLRLGSVDAALTQFKLLTDTYGYDDAGILANFAAALIEMSMAKFHLAQVRLTRLLERLPERHPLASHARLAIAETQLATGRYKQANQHLERDDFPPSLIQAVELRRADHAFAEGFYDQAFDIYDRLFGSAVMAAKPHSTNNYCSLLFDRQDYAKSKQCFLDLASMLDPTSAAGSAHYLATLAEWKAGALSGSPEAQFGSIAARFPDTEAALLAELKQADLCALAQDECDQNAGRWFRRIADNASSRALSESAAFKEALVFYLDGQYSKSIELLHNMQRIYQSGALQDEVQALLIQLLPGEIERLLVDGMDIDAIALAQQNRAFFEHGWLDETLLFQIGLAFERLSMYPEALQLLLYLKNSSAALDEEQLLISAIRAAHALGAHQLVEDLAAEYAYRHPEGAHELDVLFYRLECMYAVGQIDEALLLMPDPLPQRIDFRILEAHLNFKMKQYRRTADILLPVYRLQPENLPADTLYILAESLYELGEFSLTFELFERLLETEKYHRSAYHRMALLSERLGKKPRSAIREFDQVEEAVNDPWHRFAVQDTRFRELISNL